MGGCISTAVRPLGLDHSSTTKSNKTLADLGNNLVWLQEKSLEERYDVLELIGKGSIGEVNLPKKPFKPLRTSRLCDIGSREHDQSCNVFTIN
jgi:hypothetical protein